MTMRDIERKLVEGVLGPVIMPPQKFKISKKWCKLAAETEAAIGIASANPFAGASPKPPKGVKPIVITWTLADSHQACKEGWDIFDCDGRYEIEQHVEHPGKCKDMTDDEIVVWLISRALRGNKLATKALLHLLVIDPNWTASDISSMTKLSYLVAKDSRGKVILPASRVEYNKGAVR